jgi:hypothetical protein
MQLSSRDDAYALTAFRINHSQNNFVNNACDHVSNFAGLAVKIQPLQGKNIIEHISRSSEANSMLGQVAFGFGDIPFEFILVYSIRPTRSIFKICLTIYPIARVCNALRAFSTDSIGYDASFYYNLKIFGIAAIKTNTVLETDNGKIQKLSRRNPS